MTTLIRSGRVAEKTGISYEPSTDMKSVANFHNALKWVGGRAVAWREDEVDAWIHERVRGFGKPLPRHRRSEPDVADQEPAPRRRRRPLGSKDKRPRVRRHNAAQEPTTLSAGDA
jgi:predicted DNA-binding transcriptional regulator AlpA